MARFSFWANGILAVAAFLFLLGYSANMTQGAGSGDQYINIGVLCIFLWLVAIVLRKARF
jgi:hypothetical protein